MRLKSLASTFRASTRKFYEIVQEKQDRIMPLTPEQAIISKYLNQKPPLPTPHRRSITPDPNGPSKAVNYQDIIARSPHGSIVEREYKDAKLNLFSLNFQKIELREVYKICEKYSPDIILLQTRPENYLPRFKLIAKQKNVFSDKLYFEQLLLAPNKISKLMDPAVSSRLNKIILNEQQTKQAGQGQQAEKIFVKDHKGIMEDSVILMAGQYASANKCSILLSDLPEQPWREWICNSHSLMQLQETFKHITKNIPFYQSLKLTPEQLGCLLKPHLFLSLRDRYIATLIEMVVGSGRHKKVMSLTGVMQNEAVMHILDHQLLLRTNEAAQLEFTPIVQYLVGPPVKSSIIRNVTGWQIIEKHIILDVLHHGADIMHVPLEELALTNKIISYYGVGFNSFDENSLMRFRYDKSLEYLRLMQSQIREGSQLKRKFMLREAIRANSQQDDD